MFTSQRSLVKQFLAGSNVGPIGMDEMVDAARGEADVDALLHDSQHGSDARLPDPEPARAAVTVVERQFYDQEMAEVEVEPEPAAPKPVRKAAAKRTPRATKATSTPRKAPAATAKKAAAKTTGTTRARSSSRAKDADGLTEKERRQLDEEDEIRFNGQAARPSRPGRPFRGCAGTGRATSSARTGVTS